MLHRGKELESCAVWAEDGEIGGVEALYFAEDAWRVRYLVVNVGRWLAKRRVLIAPVAVKQIDLAEKRVLLDLTKEEVESSPEVDAHPTISREKERALHDHYQWQPYWRFGPTGAARFGVFPPAVSARLVKEPKEEAAEEAPPADEEPSNLRSTAEVMGYAIHATDGEMGHVDDLILDDEWWQVQYLVVDTGNWLPGRKVLISPGWASEIRWAESAVYVDLSREAVQNSPELDPEARITADDAAQLEEHYHQWFSEFAAQAKYEREVGEVFLAKDLMGNPVVTLDEGRIVGKAQDLYLSADLRRVTAVYLGGEGLFDRTRFVVPGDGVVRLGVDAVLIRHGDAVQQEDQVAELGNWLRRDELQGRPVDTPGGTKIGRIGDVVVNQEGDVRGFSLAQVYVKGPVAQHGSIAMEAVLDVGDADGAMTVDLEKAERQRLSVE